MESSLLGFKLGGHLDVFATESEAYAPPKTDSNAATATCSNMSYSDGATSKSPANSKSAAKASAKSNSASSKASSTHKIN